MERKREGILTCTGLLGAVLCERRVLVHSSDCTALTLCCVACAALPEQLGTPTRTSAATLAWPHVLVTALPSAVLAYAGAPSPYVIGLHSSLLDLAFEHVGERCEDLVTVDLDRGCDGVARFSRVPKSLFSNF